MFFLRRHRRKPQSILENSFLLVAGDLKVAAVYPQNDGNVMCDVTIPNKEIAFAYEKEVLNRTNQNNVSVSISQAMLKFEVDDPAVLLGKEYAGCGCFRLISYGMFCIIINRTTF